MAQYPLDMGKDAASGTGGSKGAVLPVTVDAEGKVDYGAIIKQGGNAGKTFATTHGALIPKLHDRSAEACSPAVVAALPSRALKKVEADGKRKTSKRRTWLALRMRMWRRTCERPRL